MDFTRLIDLTYNGEFIKELKFVEPVKDWIRVYYKESESVGNGFDFYVVQWCSNTSGDESFGLSCNVQCMYNGRAYFDGIRHLYMGDDKTDNYGYDYCARLDNHIIVLRELLVLEHKYCRDFESKMIILSADIEVK